MGAGRLIDEGDPDRVALLLPGRAYGPDLPLFFYARALLRRNRWTVRAIDWGALPPDPDDWGEHVRAAVRPALDELASCRRVLMLAKSLGTHAAPVAAERGIGGVWLTPLLRDDAGQRAAYREMTAPALIVGGTADQFWSATEADALRDSGWGTPPAVRSIVELPGLDHALEVPGDPVASVRSCADVMSELESFLARVGSPDA